MLPQGFGEILDPSFLLSQKYAQILDAILDAFLQIFLYLQHQVLKYYQNLMKLHF